MQSSVVVINGARCEEMLVGMVEFGALDIVLHALTEDGSHGLAWVTTTIQLQIELDREIESAKPTQILTRAADADAPLHWRDCPGAGIGCQLSIETAMPCGIGICNGCAAPVADFEAPEGFPLRPRLLGRSCL